MGLVLVAGCSSPAPAASAGPEVTPVPTAAPEPTATAVPEPTATAVPESIATPVPGPAEEAPIKVAELSFEDVRFDGLGGWASRDEVIDALGVPVAETEFEWGGGLTGHTLDYGEIYVEIHYGVSLLGVSRSGSCIQVGVCIGDSFDSVERALGSGWVSTDNLSEGETSSLTYQILGGGYCNATFIFGHDEAGFEILKEISTFCLPD